MNDVRRTWLALVALVTLGVSCTSQPTILPSRDFDRPTDVTFVCMGAFNAAPAPAGDGGGADDGGTTPASVEAGADASAAGRVLSGRPMRVCHPRTDRDPAPGVESRTFAFLPQSGSGQLAVVDADRWKLVDLDTSIGGYNQLPLGVLPSQIAASDDGCRLVTANHGSCDLSLVDPAAVLAPTFALDYPGVVAPPGSAASAVSVKAHPPGGKDLQVFPGEVAFLPHPTADQALCPANWSWRAIVTFPSCDLIALIDLPSGEIIDSAYARRKGDDSVELVPAGNAPVCAARDCDSGKPTPDDADDAGADDAGADAGADAGTDGAPPPPPTTAGKPPLRPSPIAMIPESSRAYVGFANVAAIAPIDVTLDHLTPGPAITLHDGAIGTSRLRLSIDPYADKTTGGAMIPGRFIGNGIANDPRPYIQDRQYLYAIARDGSVRVVQVAHQPEVECETNLDPLRLPAGVTLNDACTPVESIDPQMNRRPTALGPGIRLPSPPVDVAVADIRPTPADQSESSVGGAHAWVLTASGNVYFVNLDPVLRVTTFVEESGAVLACTTPTMPETCHQETEPPPNTLRNRNVLSYNLSLNPSAGPARLDQPPTAASFGARIEAIWTRGTENNATSQAGNYESTSVFFPDPSAVLPQTWSVSWEGALLSAPRLSGQVRGDAAPYLYDPGVDFCGLGMTKGDLVTLSGCNDDKQCGINQVCAHGPEGTQAAGGLPINGLCMEKGLGVDRCSSLLATIRRYDVVGTVRPTELPLVPHKDELVLPDLRPCTIIGEGPGDGGADAGSADASDADAETGDAGQSDDAAADARDASDGADGGGLRPSTCVNASDPGTSNFQCVQDNQGRRCLQPCPTAGTTTGCRAGRTCVAFDRVTDAPALGSAPSCATNNCYCADGPSLEAGSGVDKGTCIGELLGYQLSVGRAFLVQGSARGVLRTANPAPDPADPSKQICVDDPKRDVRTAMRIPMNAPMCTNVPPNQLDSRCNPDAPDRCMLTLEQQSKVNADVVAALAKATNEMGPLTKMMADKITAETSAASVAKQVTEEANDLLNIAKRTSGDPNPCLFIGGPNETDVSGSPPHVHALFRNQEVQFMMTNLETPPSGVYQIRFDVHGGTRPQNVILPSTVEVSMPARLVVGPVDSLVQTATYAGEVPYVFVVDQRRLGRTQGGGPTRGQLLRIDPLFLGVTTPKGYQPWYQDFAHSGNLFPIQ